MYKKLYLLVIISIIIHGTAYAQSARKTIAVDTASHTNKLNEVHIKARKSAKIRKDTISASLKLDLPILQIPQNVISVSSALLQQQGTLELKDAARNASGVYFGYNSTPFDNSAVLQIRGFQGFTTLNGMSRRFSYGASIDDEALIENVEFVKGPAGFLNANAEPGGSVNIVTKTPAQQHLNVVQTAGSFGLYRIAVDAGSAVKPRGFSARFNVAYQHKDSYLDFLKTEKYVVAPILQYNFSPGTFVLAEYNLVRGEAKNGASINKFRNQDDALKDAIRLNYSDAPGLPKSFAQNETGRFVIKHKFSDNWQITSQTSYLSAPYQTWYMTSKGSAVNFDTRGNTLRRASYTIGNGNTVNSQLFINGKLSTGSVKHQLLFGAEYTNSKDSISLNNGKVEFAYNKNTYINSVDPALVRQTTRTVKINNNTFLKSGFLYDNITLQNKLLLTLGARYTMYDNDRFNTTARGAQPVKAFKQHAVTPRAALTFLADSATSVFLLFDQSFVPQSGLLATATDPITKEVSSSSAADPQRGNDLELGLKRNWFQSRLLTTMNGFHTTKTNVLVTDYEHAGYVKQIGEVTSNGVEVDVIGNITDKFSISTNYTFVKARITKDVDEEQLGKELSQTPQQILNTWMQYSIPLQNMASVAFSIGQVTQLKRSTSETHEYIPNFTKFDAGISYTTDRYFLRLLADNLTGKRYMSSGDILLNDTGGKNYYFIEGEPFNIKVSAGIKF
ncbi:TonB-dependent siderophore receptor [Pedobacter duraquae]|uniref:Iron complex outermembrane receptor protein n=1 Tax=Pedobacter duraquae TaxID=425511 RepID=A0A4R6IQA3_9SPHI|nr:TonB-dependent receptor plug domain-containing protein [Pedobacter duraquae]TDO24524.1 iron complex outermembrane receptor protein [Pedobacter duraquae]